MKTLPLILCMLCLSLFTEAQIKTDWKEQDLRAKVRTLQTNTYSTASEFGEYVKKELTESSLTKFNPKGFVTESSTKGEGVFTYSYSSKNLLTQRMKDGILDQKHTHTLDNKGRKARTNIYDASDKLLGVYRYYYNASGFLVKEELYDSEGQRNQQDVYNFGANGKYSSYSSLMINNGVETEASKLVYNKRGDVIEVYITTTMILNPNYPMIYKNTSEYQYDPSGNWIKKIDHIKVIMNDIVMGSEATITERKIEYY